MSEPIGIAVIGCGGIAAAHLRALATLDEARVLYAVDVDEKQARVRAEEFDIPHVVSDWSVAFGAKDVQGVILCLPHHLHKPAAVAAAQAGKHVLTEKPIANTLADADVMIAAAREAGVILMVGQVLRFRPVFQQAREILRSGELGEVHRVLHRRISWFQEYKEWSYDPELAGGMTLLGFGSHEVDMLLWLLDQEAETVFALGQKVSPRWRDYDEISMQIRTTGGVMISSQLSCNCRHGAWEYTILGSEGTLSISSAQLRLNERVIECPLPEGGGFVQEDAEFLSAIREGREPEASGVSVRPSMAALQAARISMDEGRLVRIEEGRLV